MKATDLTYEQLFEAAKTMQLVGGGFANAIALAFFRADSTNAGKLVQAFGDLFVKFHDWPSQERT
jgi:hypothetical protein